MIRTEFLNSTVFGEPQKPSTNVWDSWSIKAIQDSVSDCCHQKTVAGIEVQGSGCGSNPTFYQIHWNVFKLNSIPSSSPFLWGQLPGQVSHSPTLRWPPNGCASLSPNPNAMTALRTSLDWSCPHCQSGRQPCVDELPRTPDSLNLPGRWYIDYIDCILYKSISAVRIKIDFILYNGCTLYTLIAAWKGKLKLERVTCIIEFACTIHKSQSLLLMTSVFQIPERGRAARKVELKSESRQNPTNYTMQVQNKHLWIQYTVSIL